MRRAWIFMVVVLTRLWIRVKSLSRKWRKERKMQDVVMFGAEMERLARLADLGEIGVDFEHCLYQMSTKEYSDRICLGPFTEPSDIKAHLYFANIRCWINLHRQKLDLPLLTIDEKILWGVANDNGDIYIVGEETRHSFNYKTANIKNESNTKSASAESDAE